MKAKDYTWKDVTEFYFPNIDNDRINDLLLSATAYPFSSVRYTCEQLHRKARQTKDAPIDEQVDCAIAIAHEETEREWEKIKENRQ